MALGQKRARRVRNLLIFDDHLASKGDLWHGWAGHVGTVTAGKKDEEKYDELGRRIDRLPQNKKTVFDSSSDEEGRHVGAMMLANVFCLSAAADIPQCE